MFADDEIEKKKLKRWNEKTKEKKIVSHFAVPHLSYFVGLFRLPHAYISSDYHLDHSTT